MTEGYWDIHNHILPGVDDGSDGMEDTRLLLAAEYEQGIRNIIFTPHCRPGMFEVSAEDREHVFCKIKRYAADDFPDLRLFLGCEFFAHEGMLGELRDPRCRMAGSDAVLLEFSTISNFQEMYEAVLEVLKAGYRVILAHPERYCCLQKNIIRVHRLRVEGVLIQLNAGSILGRSGRKQKLFCRALLKENLVDLVASDAHDPKNRPVEMAHCMKLIEKKYGRAVRKRLFFETQRELFYETAG